MIKNTFLILEGISNKTEQNLWNYNIKDWNTFLNTQTIKGINLKRKGYYDRKLKQAISQLYNLNSEYFTNLLPLAEHWRLYEFFKQEAVFLDIETSGVESNSYITVIGLFDGTKTKTMVKDINLDFNVLKKELKNYKLIITFNGNTFDIPFLEKYCPGLFPNIPKIDLRHLCARVDLRGGLKQIEKKLNIKRSNKIVEQLYGGDAIKLWRKWKATGDRYFLNLLVEYNEEDVINLKQIIDIVAFKLENKTYL